MKRTLVLCAATAAALSMTGPASAQTRANDAGWWPWAGSQWQSASFDDRRAEEAYDREDREDRESASREDRQSRGSQNRGKKSDDRRVDGASEGGKGNGPPFCRNGQGHPTKGMEWCRAKGWTSWDRAAWSDVILRSPRRSSSAYDQSTIGDILGNVVLGRLTSYARGLGVRAALDARAVDLGTQGSVLQVRAGGLPLAELTDFDRDGRVDLVLLAQR